MKNKWMLFIATAFLCHCGLEHLKRTDLSERSGVSVSSSISGPAVGVTENTNTKSPQPPVSENPVINDASDELSNSPVQDEPDIISDDPLIIPENIPENLPDDVPELPAIPQEPEFDWQRILITEVVTDPQQDHSDTTGTAFDSFPGTGAVTATDEFVEIYNGTAVALDVSGWRLGMLDGSNESLTLGNSSATYFSGTSNTISDFGPGEIMVVGNPPGSMNNNLSLELFDENGALVDSVQIEDGNALDFSDEARFLSEDGNWLSGQSSPGYFSW